MIVKKLRLRNFRAFDRLIINFEHDITVIAGVNGVGKSTILEALSKLISQILPTITSSNSRRRYFNKKDIKYNKNRYFIDLIMSDDDGHSLQRRNLINRDITELADDVGYLDFSSNVIGVYYSTDRSLTILPRKIPLFNENIAYAGALLGKPIEIKYFISWYVFQKEHNLDRKSITDAVENAIYSFLPGFSDLNIISTPYPDITLKKVEDILSINQMSDGENNLISMVIDLARRLALANPDSSDPLKEGKAIVLIDEIELHLHPDWQRTIIKRLIDTFPKCQFILTTHSPQVLGEVEARCIRYLDRDKNTNKIYIDEIEQSYGQSTDRILEDIMKVSSRSLDIKTKIRDLFIKIENGHIEESKILYNKLKQEIGEDPLLVRADLIIQRKEIIGK
jgi:predicted ATP-binding protein involved in virulence